MRRVCTATRRKERGGLGGLGWEIEWIDWGDILRWRAGSGVAGRESMRHEEFGDDGGDEGGDIVL